MLVDRWVKLLLAETRKTERTPKKPVHLAKDISRQNVDSATWLLVSFDKMQERDELKKNHAGFEQHLEETGQSFYSTKSFQSKKLLQGKDRSQDQCPGNSWLTASTPACAHLTPLSTTRGLPILKVQSSNNQNPVNQHFDWVQLQIL